MEEEKMNLDVGNEYDFLNDDDDDFKEEDFDQDDDEFKVNSYQQKKIKRPRNEVQVENILDDEAKGSRKRRSVYNPQDYEKELSQGKKLMEKLGQLKDDQDRLISSEFLELPPDSTPNYYSTIKKPISFKEINEKIDNRLYNSITDLRNDLELCFQNAKKFNAKGSQIFNDAKLLLKKTKEHYQRFIDSGDIEGDLSQHVDEDGQPHQPVKGKRGRPKGINKYLKKILDKLVGHRDRNSQRVLSDAFMNLPSDKEVPYYYDVIENPMAIDIVQTNIRDKNYSTIVEFVDDVDLMFNNAMHFNEENSEIHQDAKELQQVLYELIRLFVPPEMISEKLQSLIGKIERPKIKLSFGGQKFGQNPSASPLPFEGQQQEQLSQQSQPFTQQQQQQPLESLNENEFNGNLTPKINFKPSPFTPQLMNNNITSNQSNQTNTSSNDNKINYGTPTPRPFQFEGTPQHQPPTQKPKQHYHFQQPNQQLSQSQVNDSDQIEPSQPTNNTVNIKRNQQKSSLKAIKVHNKFVTFDTFIEQSLNIPIKPGNKALLKSFSKIESTIDPINDVILRFNGVVITPNLNTIDQSQPNSQNWYVEISRQNSLEIFVTHKNKSDGQIESTEIYRLYIQAGH